MRRLSLVLALALLAACSSSSPPAGIARDGIVTLPLTTDVAGTYGDVDRASEPLDRPGPWEGELAVLGADLPAAERIVVVLEPSGPGNAPFERATEPPLEVAGHRAAYGLRFGTPPITCGGAELSVELPSGFRLLVTGVAPVDRSTLEEVAAQVGVRGERLDLTGLPRPYRQLGRLPARWLHGGGGSRVTDSAGVRLVRRISARERPVLLALRCPTPTRFLSPPPSEPPNVLAHREPSVQRVDDRRIDVGLLGGRIALAVTEGDPGVALLWSYACCGVPPTAKAMARMATHASTVSASELATLDEKLRDARRGPPRSVPGSRLLLSGHDGDLLWDIRRVERDHRVCVDLGAIGHVGTGWGEDCLDESAAGPAVLLGPDPVGPDLTLLWGAVGPDVAAVEVEGAGRPPRRVPTHALAGSAFRRVFVAAVQPEVIGFGPLGGESVPLSELQLWGGRLTVHTLDAAGRVLHSEVVGR
ncbi:MAG: hypothetical protein JWO68_2380 [Actinomycetia bacterium]|nr:hypothetical protein [Actinomycetes bacterium]